MKRCVYSNRDSPREPRVIGRLKHAPFSPVKPLFSRRHRLFCFATHSSATRTMQAPTDSAADSLAGAGAATQTQVQFKLTGRSNRFD